MTAAKGTGTFLLRKRQKDLKSRAQGHFGTAENRVENEPK